MAPREAARQQRERFEQWKRQDDQWFRLRLTMGYTAVIVLPAVFIVAAVILFWSDHFSPTVVNTASGALFIDVGSVVLCAWRIALSPAQRRTRPPTAAESDDEGGDRRDAA